MKPLDAFCLVAIVLGIGGVSPLPAQHDDAATVRRSLQHLLGHSRVSAASASYALAWADLNGDGRREAIVYIDSPDWCGTGGCTLMILTPSRSGYSRLGWTPATRPPIRLLSSRHNGWRDIAVFVRETGVELYQRPVVNNGGRYRMANPSGPEAAWPGGGGSVLISQETPSRPLWPEPSPPPRPPARR